MSESSLITANNVSLVIGSQTILSRVDLALPPGKIVTLIGPNGAGKSSLVRLMLGLQRPSSGTIVRRQPLTIGYMPQKLQLDPSLPMTVERFLRLATPYSRAAAKGLALTESLALTGVEHLQRSSMHHLSGGETQRVLLARALLRRPDLLVLDEPAQGVDISGQARLYQLIADIRDQQGCGVLMVSHDLHLVMAATDTVICLNQHICCHGHPEAVTAHPAYLELFGHRSPAGIAIYTHHHDHDHDMHGNVTDGPADHCCDHPGEPHGEHHA